MESRGAAAQVTCSSSRTKTCDLGGGPVPQANAVIVFCRASCGASMPRDIVSVSYVLEETARGVYHYDVTCVPYTNSLLLICLLKLQ